MKPLVSIIMPVFNSERYLPKSIESVLCQTVRDFELLCVDNGSTDGSMVVLQAKAHEDPRIVVLQEPRKGVSNARNAGLSRAVGDYVVFLDADVFVSSNLLEQALGKAKAGDADMTIFGFDEYRSEEGAFFQREVCGAQELYDEAFVLRDVSCLSTEITTPNVWRILFKRSFVESKSIRFETDLRTAEDLAFIYEALFSAATISLLADRLYHYRRDVPTSLTRSNREGDGMKALDHIHCYLERAEHEDQYRRHFVNLVLDTVRYGLETAADSCEFKNLYACYHEKWHGYIARNQALVDGRYKSFFQDMCTDSVEQYAFSLYADMRTRHEETVARLAKAENDLRVERDREAACRAELEDVIGSHSFRVGRMLMYVPSRIKSMITHS